MADMTVEYSAEFGALVLQAWQGEVYGVEVYGALAERRSDPGETAKLNVLVELEEHMELRLSHVLVELKIEPDFGDVMANADEDVAAAAAMSWPDLLTWLTTDAETALGDYVRMAERTPDDIELKAVVAGVVAHERALIAFCDAERSGGSDSLSAVRALLPEGAS